ncbi:MAG TPA: hypothetical protein VJZ00_09190 [Thermoanaerobaculia bacterium]|nr:hypothetical protein [Thermoanaerobaculia bacterium]
MRSRAALLVVVLSFATLASFAQDRGPSTPEERAHALQLIRSLENDPLGPGAKDARQWLTIWLTTIPDITVALCGEFTKPLLGQKKNYASEIFIQSMYSSAAAVIEHPELNGDAEAKYLAGVEGSLRAYESIRRSKPKVSWPMLDALIAKRDAGQLAAFVREKALACK